MSVHVGSRLIVLLSVVGNFFVLSVVSSIFRPLSIVGWPIHTLRKGDRGADSLHMKQVHGGACHLV